MRIAELREAGVHVVAPAGRIDTTTAGLLEQCLDPLLSGPAPRIVLDFADVEYISSAGLRILLVAVRRVQQLDGRLALCRLGHPVRQVFYLAGFLPLFVICDTRAEAIAEAAP